MKVVKYLFIFLLVVIAAFVGVGFVLPDTVHVERSAVIDARPATLFTLLDGFRQFNKWSPWAELDPNTKYTWEGPASGVGSKESWSSADRNVGNGSQEIVQATPYSMIRVKLVFNDFGSDSFATYTLTSEGEGTRLVWGYDANFGRNIAYRYFGPMMDGMLGKDYEHGLAKLKALAESLPKDDFAGTTVELLDLKAVPLATASAESPAEQSGPILKDLYGKLKAFVAAAGLNAAGAPIAITRDFNDDTHFWKFDAALQLDQPCSDPADGTIHCVMSYVGQALRVEHKGPYSTLAQTYARLLAYKAAAGYADNGNSWEQYLNDAATTPEAELITHVYWPVK
jgi:effector-binding domain-containing protein